MNLQKQVIKEMKVKPCIHPEEEINKSIQLMKDYMQAYPFLKTLVLGISGGQDSTLLGKLAQQAVAQLRKETGDDAYKFIAVRLPYGEQIDEAFAQEVIRWIAPDRVCTVDIKPAVDATVDSLQRAGVSISDFNKGNIKARQRMIVQYAIATACAGVVLGTDHAAESVVGFYTKFGDGASDLVPLYRLNKRQGAAMLKALGAPAAFYEKIPTADLEEKVPAQPDEVALGVSYKAIDDYLEGRTVAEEDRKCIERLYLNSQHKRHLPITIFDNFWKNKDKG
ncbi:ammonia-dependent NAD(+) synthetase [Allofustis seminis]|uniref:ammonia-dependent NAD(+) synthetase n=1 Tax=Allofustis seminis TaxID=166939 RepID=UPI0003787FBB|nr:ammonia-dependent NAD(+) synthetase [Allofustis seminis]